LTDDNALKAAAQNLTKAKADILDALKHKGEERRKMVDAGVLRAERAIAQARGAMAS
jgi:glutamate formiminotransferase